MSTFQEERPRKSSQIGPWVESNDKDKQQKSSNNDSHHNHYHNFLNSIKYSKKSHRKRNSVQQETKKQLAQPKIEQIPVTKNNPEIYYQNKIDELESLKKWKSKENDLLNTTLYYCNYKTDLQEPQSLNLEAKNRKSQRQFFVKRGSSNLQKLLKIKEKLRTKNHAYLRKVKEGTAVWENRGFKMEGRKSSLRSNSVDNEMKNFLYKTLQASSNIKYKKKTLQLIE